MKSKPIFEIPDELSLQSFFGVEPLESVPEDGYWCYEIIDPFSIRLRVSFNTHERSFQTTTFMGDRKVITVSQEGAVKLSLVEGGQILRGEFWYSDAHSTVDIRIQPEIWVHWATLVDL